MVRIYVGHAMKLDALLSRTRYLAIVLPLFALASTVQAGCSEGTNFYQGRYGGGYKTSEKDGLGSCVVYRTDDSGGNGYFGPCNDDADAEGDGYADDGYREPPARP